MPMKRYDYSGFSLSRIREPRFSHLLLLGGWLVYFSLYFLTENLIPYERCHPVHCALDDLIPFNEFFVCFYVGWYLLVAGSLAFTLFFDVPRFRKLQVYIMLTQLFAMIWYILWPSRQDLRPEVFQNENLFTWILGLIYSFDTPTGVCPSLHAAYSLAILSVGLKMPYLPKWLKLLLTADVLLICAAVCFVKQHSAVDVFAAAGMCLVIEGLVYGREYWIPLFKKTR